MTGEIRCKKCNRLLMKGKLHEPSWIEVKCPKCGYIHKIWGTVECGRIEDLKTA